MDINKNLNDSERFKRERQNKFDQEYKKRSAERLNHSLETKFKTTFIGALSAFEDAFGDEWGDRLPEQDLTDEQYDKRKLWEQVRTRVLNNGNNQLRAAQEELSEYTVEWNRHQTQIHVRKQF